MAIEDITLFDYEYLTGTWTGPYGACFNVVSEDCRDSGWGEYGKPTERGEKAISYFEKYGEKIKHGNV